MRNTTAVQSSSDLTADPEASTVLHFHLLLTQEAQKCYNFIYSGIRVSLNVTEFSTADGAPSLNWPV